MLQTIRKPLVVVTTMDWNTTKQLEEGVATKHCSNRHTDFLDLYDLDKIPVATNKKLKEPLRLVHVRRQLQCLTGNVVPEPGQLDWVDRLLRRAV